MKIPIVTAKSGKGQVFTWDLAISISIFLVVMAMIFYMWDSTISKSTEAKDTYEVETIATDVTEQLIRTPGIPNDWENSSKYNISDIIVIGLADAESRILDEEKILMFITLTDSDYETVRELLGTRRYDFYFNITYLNETLNETIEEKQLFINDTISEIPVYAGEPPINALFTLTARRTAVLNDTIVRIYFTVWTNMSYTPTAR